MYLAVLQQLLSICSSAFIAAVWVSSIKSPEIRDLAQDNEPQLIAIIETWLTSDIRDSWIAVPGFLAIRHGSSKGRAGAVLLYYDNSLRHPSISHPFTFEQVDRILITFPLPSLNTTFQRSVQTSRLQHPRQSVNAAQLNWYTNSTRSLQPPNNWRLKLVTQWLTQGWLPWAHL